MARLFELSPKDYFDISVFPNGETKRALERVLKKSRRIPEANGPPQKKKGKSQRTPKGDVSDLTKEMATVRI